MSLVSYLPSDAAAVRAASGGLTEHAEFQFALIGEMRQVLRAIQASGGAKRHQLAPPIKMPERPKPKPAKPRPIREQFLEAFGPPKMKGR